ncbi:MAG: RHS repeat domain-containing protein [Nitrospira sp.]
MNRLSGRTDPLGRSESYAYDLVGNLKQFTDRKGQTTTFTYDALNRLTGRGLCQWKHNDAGLRYRRAADVPG